MKMVAKGAIIKSLVFLTKKRSKASVALLD